MDRSEFDAYAASYDRDLARGLALTGEGKGYYARRRLEILATWLGRLGFAARSVLDFGCGIGDTAPLFRAVLGSERVLGVDPSAESIARARTESAGPGIEFATTAELEPGGSHDLAFVNGVFHHIPPAERLGAIGLVRRALRPGGLLALWENNPWNPGTRLIMRRVAFDRDAIMLSAPETRRLLQAGGFEIVGTAFAFVFPRPLAWLRGLEPLVSGLPLGGQYLVLGRAP